MSKRKEVSAEDLSAIKEYLYLDGSDLRYKKAPHPKFKVGELAGGLCTRRYKRVTLLGVKYQYHHVVYFLYYGKWPENIVDHINGDSSDNNPENLRDVTQAENLRGFRPVQKNSRQNFRGVGKQGNCGRFVAITQCEGKVYRKYGFTDEREAAMFYNYQAESLGFSPEAFNQVFEDVPKEMLDVET